VLKFLHLPLRDRSLIVLLCPATFQMNGGGLMLVLQGSAAAQPVRAGELAAASVTTNENEYGFAQVLSEEVRLSGIDKNVENISPVQDLWPG
jgi:hypothetical protein